MAVVAEISLYRNFTEDDMERDASYLSIDALPSGSDLFLDGTGRTFVEWNTLRDGSGTSVPAGEAALDYTENTFLYAIWNIVPKRYIAEEASLTAIADAIRTKSGATGQLSFPTGFVNAISGISRGGPTKMIHGNGTETVTLTPEESWFDEDFHIPTRNSFCIYLQYFIDGDLWMAMAFDPADDLVAYSCESDYTIYRARFSCTYNNSKLSSITMYEFSVCSVGFEDPGEDYTESIGDWYIMYFEF